MRFCLIFLAFCAILASTFAITCYDCDSIRDPRCNEYFSAEGVQQTDCDDAEMPEYLQKYGRRIEATGCLTKFHEGIEGRRYFIRRSCYFGKLDDTDEACEAEDPYMPFANLLGCNVCDEDLCNTDAAPVNKPAVLTILAITLGIVVLARF